MQYIEHMKLGMSLHQTIHSHLMHTFSISEGPVTFDHWWFSIVFFLQNVKRMHYKGDIVTMQIYLTDTSFHFIDHAFWYS